ncbi:MAG: hemolysin family protein [SAR202 cluster bacterium]|nr:hemolysin family protein [SAR202 cluster bacterium]
MDTDSTYSALALAISIAVFGLTEIAASSIAIALRTRAGILTPDRDAFSGSLAPLLSIPAGPTAPLRLLNLGSVAATVLSTAALVSSISGTRWLLVAIAVAAMLGVLGLLLSLCRNAANAWTDQISGSASHAARLISYPLYPVLILQSVLLKGFRAPPDQESGAPGDIAMDVELGVPPAGEPLDEHEVRMIRAVVELDTTVAREIMVPRVDIEAVESGTPVRALAEQMVAGGHSRIPIYEGDLDHVVGVAHARDILQYLINDDQNGGLSSGSVTRPALFIPESKSLEELLDEFQAKRVHLAVVIDEYGGVSGLVTIEDLLEEIVGEIQDEFDVNEDVNRMRPVGNNQYLIDARMSIDQLNEDLEASVENDGFDTVGGFVFDRLGKIPVVGDTVAYDGMRIEVLSTVGRRLKTLRVTRL